MILHNASQYAVGSMTYLSQYAQMHAITLLYCVRYGTDGQAMIFNFKTVRLLLNIIRNTYAKASRTVLKLSDSFNTGRTALKLSERLQVGPDGLTWCTCIDIYMYSDTCERQDKDIQIKSQGSNLSEKKCYFGWDSNP